MSLLGNATTSLRILDDEIQISDAHYFASGGFANIWRGTTLTDTNGNVKIRLRREFIIWSDLSHENILPIYGTFTHEPIGGTGVVLPFRPLGTISTFLETYPTADKLALIYEIAEGIRYLHSKDIVHGDLTVGNILIHQKGTEHNPQYIPQLTDFGRSRIIDKKGFTTNIFTAYSRRDYTLSRSFPPEVLHADNPQIKLLTKESDVYTFAMVALEIVTGKQPFYKRTDSQAVFLVMSGTTLSKNDYAGPEAPQLTERFWNLFLMKCWSTSPEGRPSIEKKYFTIPMPDSHAALAISLDTGRWLALENRRRTYTI
ncbi:kinase-like domain-containing protein [Crucibulum laeve]|uniref:Kinase-like domain-containing protein n=1 Tax=Crucibulum laeve TaxID=68775 RepID=A0A5C3M2F3_9AGAR|nr:kinase-like domain-containing protein [Crucibulum laeve]